MKKLLTLAAVGETATGLALLIIPSLVVRLLFDAEILGVGVVMSRLVGIALIGLGVACWPGPPLIGMLTYSVLAMLYLTSSAYAANGSGRFCGRQLYCTRC